MTSQSTGPVFPAVPNEYVRAGLEWFFDSTRMLAEQLHPMLADFTRQTLPELPDFDATAEPDLNADFRQFVHRLEFAVLLDTAVDFDIAAVHAHIRDLADRSGQQQVDGMVGFMSDTATASGNVVATNDADPIEAMIAGIEQMDIEFDENGNHNLRLIITPSFHEYLRTHLPTEEQGRRIDAILDAKREEQRAARSHRRLS